MTSKEEDIHNKIIAEILKTCTDGCTEQNIIEQTHLSHDQLRRIMADGRQRIITFYRSTLHIHNNRSGNTFFLKNATNF
jgi:hypothetical protein